MRVQGHQGEVWGLDFLRTEGLFITGAHDGLINLFEAESVRPAASRTPR